MHGMHAAVAALPYNSERPSPVCCYCVGLSVAVCFQSQQASLASCPLLPSVLHSTGSPAVHFRPRAASSCPPWFDQNFRRLSPVSWQLFAISPSICLIDRALHHLSSALTELMPTVSRKKISEKNPFCG